MQAERSGTRDGDATDWQGPSVHCRRSGTSSILCGAHAPMLVTPPAPGASKAQLWTTWWRGGSPRLQGTQSCFPLVGSTHREGASCHHVHPASVKHAAAWMQMFVFSSEYITKLPCPPPPLPPQSPPPPPYNKQSWVPILLSEMQKVIGFFGTITTKM